MDFLPKEINDYCTLYTQKEDDVLYRLHRETHQKILRPRMLSGHLQGQLLTFFSKMIQPEYILEIGTYTGYSAICLARGLKKGGKLYTIDVNEELEDFALSFIEKAGLKECVEMHVGDATKVVPSLKRKWDLVFIDADKENYINYYNLVFDSVKKGGFLIFDNVLWSGKVTQKVDLKDRETVTLVDLAKLLQEDERVENVLLPVRDGLFMVRKK
ncbi:MAG: methyltransferase [Flavobacteriales bacterium]|mgnify:CR=1 FL=1|nr:methyltransferase [Flavobacteriales bacterium]|tara:strand:- start:185 stop:826 length:642 start_codon:yes stop_codon:yes gene_type:complete